MSWTSVAQIQFGINARMYAAKLVVLVKLSWLRDGVRVEGTLSGTFAIRNNFFFDCLKVAASALGTVAIRY